MKKALIILMAVIFVFASFPVTTSATQNYNLCDKFEAVSGFHQLFTCYEDHDIVYPGYVEREVPPGQLYPTSIIVAAADMMYHENPEKWTLMSTPIYVSDTEPISPIIAGAYQYFLVQEDEYFSFLKTRFNITDALIMDLKNHKSRDYTHVYDENGRLLYDAVTKTFIVTIKNHDVWKRNPYRKFIGYVKNGENYDVYLNMAEPTQWENPPADTEEYVDYIKQYSIFTERFSYFAITNDWMKYTVTLNGDDIKYLSQVKVDSIPENLIRPNDIVPGEPVFDNTVSSTVTDVSSKPAQTQSSVPEDVSSTLASDEVISEPSKAGVTEDTSSAPSSDIITIGATKDNDDQVEPFIKKTNFALPIIIAIIIIVVGAVAAVLVIFKKEKQVDQEKIEKQE